MTQDFIESELAGLGLLLQYRRACAKRQLCADMPRPSLSDVLSHLSSLLGSPLSEEQLPAVAKLQCLNVNQLIDCVSLELNFLRWCAINFESRVGSVFLAKKQGLTRLSYSLIRLKDRCLAFELFHRLGAGEATFVDLAFSFSEGEEAIAGGFIAEAEALDIADEFSSRLLAMAEGETSAPFQYSDYWILLRLNKMVKASLDPAVQSRILRECGDEQITSMITSHPSLIAD